MRHSVLHFPPKYKRYSVLIGKTLNSTPYTRAGNLIQIIHKHSSEWWMNPLPLRLRSEGVSLRHFKNKQANLAVVADYFRLYWPLLVAILFWDYQIRPYSLVPSSFLLSVTPRKNTLSLNILFKYLKKIYYIKFLFTLLPRLSNFFTIKVITM